ncbi:deoxyribose-phosphate aldolase [Alicyclobacillus tolerans]|uniref:Deoxyribose-phosphate aldolase n=1 Tax=Alicyclobacillus tolerans TaxID=90970 RepID=A0A1M6JXD7_9BACL|nr:deoxyribose-phosphate aldolase [Alicyclobacillus montanus]SHJ51318.1 deoxyribose-phosphate aldolase [Alicyclobacillus montanus]
MKRLQPIERAAGGLVIRRKNGEREVLLIDDAYGHVALPKGHLEPGESWEAAAVREIEEETGIRSRLVASLGRVEYPVMRHGTTIHKEVRMFLLEADDALQEPRHQAEEIQSAYYLPWEDAKQLHAEKGYMNWHWIFDKAKVFLDGGQMLRQTWDDTEPDTQLRVHKVRPLVISLLDSVVEEISATHPAIMSAYLQRVGQSVSTETPQDALAKVHHVLQSLPYPTVSRDALNTMIDHTLLRPDAGLLDVLTLCEEAKEHQFAAVCVQPRYVRDAVEALAGSTVSVCTVLGFPHGAVTPEQLVFETSLALASGAEELDVVIPFGAMVEDDVQAVMTSVSAVVETVNRLAPQAMVKAILETSALTVDRVMKASIAALAAGVDYIKTSTGFHTAGAHGLDVYIMQALASPAGAHVKASGGVRTMEVASMMLSLGVERIGTSSGVHLVRQ